ncbi:hypothetical protein V6N13_091045 [Hibiscus sabdariffa]
MGWYVHDGCMVDFWFDDWLVVAGNAGTGDVVGSAVVGGAGTGGAVARCDKFRLPEGVRGAIATGVAMRGLLGGFL